MTPSLRNSPVPSSRLNVEMVSNDAIPLFYLLSTFRG